MELYVNVDSRIIIIIVYLSQEVWSRDSPVDWTAGVQFPLGSRDFSLLDSVQTASGALPVSYIIGTRGCFSGDKAAGV
jgi:hypothetical protein